MIFCNRGMARRRHSATGAWPDDDDDEDDEDDGDDGDDDDDKDDYDGDRGIARR